MRLQITIYLSLTFFVFGVGYIIFSSLLNNNNELEASPLEGAQSPEPLAPPPPQSLLVKSVQGLVERSSVAKDLWTPVLPGNELFADERIRTDRNASVKLQADDKSRIELDGQSEISIQEITDTVHRIRLELGKLDVDYQPSESRQLKITTAKDAGKAETRAGRFVIQNTDGKLSVATEKGEVSLSGASNTVRVGPGKLSYIMDGGNPTKPEPIPLSVMLRVANPQKTRQTDRSTVIKGKTDVSATVHINDQVAEVDQNGRFQLTLPLEQGRNKIQVVATTAYGRAEKALPTVTVTNPMYTKTNATVERAEVRWGTTKRKRKTKTPNADRK
jgi:hypothetical protein